MPYRVKNKLKTATKIYTVEPVIDKATQVRIQLPTREYVQIELNLPFPRSVTYISLTHGGFNYDPLIDIPITHNSANETKRILKNSIDFRSNNSDTIEKLILLIDEMTPYI
jgi:hypothetical protein